MNTIIAVPVDSTKKHMLIKNLRNKGLTTKAFITFCIDAFNKGELDFWIIPSHDRDVYLTVEERENVEKALKKVERGEYDTLDEFKKEIWLTV